MLYSLASLTIHLEHPLLHSTQFSQLKFPLLSKEENIHYGQRVSFDQVWGSHTPIWCILLQDQSYRICFLTPISILLNWNGCNNLSTLKLVHIDRQHFMWQVQPRIGLKWLCKMNLGTSKSSLCKLHLNGLSKLDIHRSWITVVEPDVFLQHHAVCKKVV